MMMSLFPMATGWLSEHPIAKIPAYFYYLVYLLWCISYYLLEYVLLIDNDIPIKDKRFKTLRIHSVLDLVLLILSIIPVIVFPISGFIFVLIQIFSWIIITE